jgi:hypothetical protein
MKYLKLYEEHDTIPDNFIRLNSIGHVLDPEEGVIYAMWKRGGYDHENPYDVSYDGSIDGLSDEDREIVDKYWLSIEPVVKQRINWELVENAKDLSLDYLDEGYYLNIQVLIEDFPEFSDLFGEEEGVNGTRHLVYFETFSHDFNNKEYKKFFPVNTKFIKESKELVYRFSFNVDRSRQNLMTSYLSNTDKMNGELKTKLEEMFPTEKLIIK